MPEKLSSELSVGHAENTKVAAGLSVGQRVLLLCLNCIPLVHAAMVAVPFFLPVDWSLRILMASAALYVVPAFVVRAILACSPIVEGKIAVGTKDFFIWWTTLQWQILFCRFPALEELLRLIPGLYSNWLRLWGARIGRLTYWAPGTLILDRPFLEIGDDVVFGAGVRLNAHVLVKNESDQTELLLGTIIVGHRTSIGGYSLLTAGTEIADSEATRAFLISPPFSKWMNGQRVRGSSNES